MLSRTKGWKLVEMHVWGDMHCQGKLSRTHSEAWVEDKRTLPMVRKATEGKKKYIQDRVSLEIGHGCVRIMVHKRRNMTCSQQSSKILLFK